RAKIVGAHSGAGPGPTELRHFVDRLVAADRAVLGELAPIPGLTAIDGWAAVTEVYGASAKSPAIDAAHTVAAARRAGARIRAVATTGARIAIATAHPASLLSLYLAVARLARECGADLIDLPDVGPLRADGRASRWVRWVDGVATVTDLHELS